jgi:RNA polymerase sigma-70 factor (ECF subfamily)
VPGPEDWAERLNSVLTVVYLVFTTGYAAGPGAGRDLCEEGIYLGRMLNELRPNEAEVEGCLALMLITHARMGARVGSEGVTIPLSMQDRSLWNQTSIDQGLAHLQTAMERRRPGPFQLKAAIAACHVHPAAPDWPQIAVLYGALMHWEPSPIVALNQAVAQMESGDLAAAVQSVGALGDTLANYQPFHAAHAEVLRRNGHTADAIAAYDRAIALADRPEDAAFLRNRRAALQQ